MALVRNLGLNEQKCGCLRLRVAYIKTIKKPNNTTLFDINA